MSRREAKLWQALWITLLVGFILRLCSAYFVYGPQALDDYKHGVLPAYQWASGELVTLPSYRSFLLTWILGWPIRLLQQWNIHDAITQVRVVYVQLALFSLLAWAGLICYAKTFSSRRFALYTMVLLAVYPLMPFVSTRAFGEALALPLVLAGLTLAEAGRRTQKKNLFFIGLLVLGFGAFFRFQVGILYVVYMAQLVWRREWSWLRLSIFVGIILLVAQAAVDLLSSREVFSTLKDYWLVNEGGAAQYGVSPWYNTWLLVLGLTLFPLSLSFVRELRWLWRRHWRLIVPLFIFVLIHSLMPHKEERFMYPILGLLLLLLADLLAKTRRRPFTRFVYIPILVLLSVVGLSITCFNNTQVGEIGPAALINQRFPKAALIDKRSLLGPSRIKDFFVRPPSEVMSTEESLDAKLVDQTLARGSEWQAVGLLTSDPDVQPELKSLEGVTTTQAHCGPVLTASNWTDALLYRMNPRHNQRRRPTWYVICERRN